MTYIMIISMAVFLTMIVISLGVYSHFVAREEVQTWSRRVRSAGEVSNESSLSPTVSFWLSKCSDLLVRLGASIKPKDEQEVASIKLSLMQAGYRSEQAIFLFIGLKLVLAAVGIALVSLVPAAMWGFPSQQELLVYYMIAACVGYLLPMVWLRLAVQSRQDKLQTAIPDALDLLVTCVEAGLGLDLAIAKVSNDISDSHPVLGEELTQLSLELRTGLAREDALRRLATRTGLEDVRTLVAVLVQTDRFGTSVAQALRVHADSMRVKRQMRAETLAAKLPVKMLFPLIFFILPSLFVVMLGPGVIRIFRILLPMASQAGS